LSLIQAAWDAAAARGLAPFNVAAAVVGRAAYGLAGATYLILPALVLGIVWSLAARGLMRRDRIRP
jgi:hypothetical protein